MELGSPSSAAAPRWPAASVAVCGVPPDSPVGRALEVALGAAARFCDTPSSPSELVIGVHGSADAAAADRLDAWARAARVAALSVWPRATDAVIGPLAVPGRAGCGRCARSRMAAAAAAAGGPGEPAPGDASGEADALPPEVIAVLVREITAILGASAIESHLVDHVLVCSASGGASRHRVIAPAYCAVCGGAAAWPATPPVLRLSADDDDPAPLLAALAGWLDPHTGVISRIALELSGDAGREPPIIATASPPHVVTEGGELRRLPLGWGKGMTLSGALLSAVGEAIERYASSLPDPARVIAARCDELDAYLDPRDLALYSDEQYDRDGFAFRRFDPGVRHPWVRGTWLDTGAPVWVPAVLAYLSLDLVPEQQICQGTSNGLAAGGDAGDAALRAILELVERDAFMAAWMIGGGGGRPIDLDDSLDPALAAVVAGVAALGARVELVELSTAACGTVVLALALGDGERYPGATIGLGADLDPRAAVRQAILELAQTGPHLCRLMRTRALPIPERPSDVRDMIQHAVYYFPAVRAAALDRVRGVGPAVALRDLAAPDAPRSLATCAGALAAAGIRIALVDVTSPDVATGPFRVVRAISPQLQPISYGHGLDHPPVERLRASGAAGSSLPIHPLW
jgi:ribosomal protein S12 methylthiotransferase accessory factor